MILLVKYKKILTAKNVIFILEYKLECCQPPQCMIPRNDVQQPRNSNCTQFPEILSNSILQWQQKVHQSCWNIWNTAFGVSENTNMQSSSSPWHYHLFWQIRPPSIDHRFAPDKEVKEVVHKSLWWPTENLQNFASHFLTYFYALYLLCLCTTSTYRHHK